MSEADYEKTISVNRKARYDYHIEESYEAGLVLLGSEIKAIRAGRVNLRDAYGVIRNGEAWLLNMHIGPWDQAGHMGHEPRRERKLLLHKYQINRLTRNVEAKGYTLVPLRMYLRDGLAKVELALAKGKRQYDKREAIAKRDTQRRIDQALRRRR
ncbi:MAG: SsrA-binding protein [Anaerolineales bacterium]|nr:SsrA-binding protein [Anaerolineales bacterium]